MPLIPTKEATRSVARVHNVVALQHDLGAAHTREGSQVILSGDVLFDFDQDRLHPDAGGSLAPLAVLMTGACPRGLEIVGYTDSARPQP